ncbi:hypothetical protein SKAU_G00355050 [Synaphobranchus kaupii]|uniref:Major intrinsically disordered Notch2-binding receptor 1-like C-terminal domain-containing protein n=1 Tax=Synaphobranchus kaupii TaxID=118154 RepID=A0A9Q1EH45_SYNKA|nr:hypothetical protein SKAU_G00355050 [Synaphobranchus kaupii]
MPLAGKVSSPTAVNLSSRFCSAEDPRDLSFWLEDPYTPGYDSLLKKTEAEHKRNKICKMVTLVVLSLCVLIVIITVPIVVIRNRG